MLIHYFNCTYAEADRYDIMNSEGEWEDDFWVYQCHHLDSTNGYCDLDNKWNCSKDECTLLDRKV